MTASTPAVQQYDVLETRDAVNAVLDDFLAGKAGGPDGPLIGTPLAVLRHFLDGGGKRVRPLYCCLGWSSVGNEPLNSEVLRAAAGLELFHTFALVHDDLIDGSDSRHDRPTAHHAFAAHGPSHRAEWFGESSAVLLGDLCEVWSAELLGDLGGGPAQAVVRETVDRMRCELVIGQYLDLLASGDDSHSVEDALRVIHYKTTKYTVERPLQIGAALAGAGPDVLDACAAYARPLGEAFQMYDDLEDVVVDAARPGTSGSDVREGKRTAVLALALQHARPAEAERLRELVGDPALGEEELAEARALIAATGAPDLVRAMVVERRLEALSILESAPFHPAAKDGLKRLTDLAVPGVAGW
ncbi:polyprenyl synthetase family protein [Streptomyces sp. NPDC012935]|uniref:polyprenyl synthetase family protein n=1 Tax=Streptomyces sp. NPDC012935 TaxID=3364857 RepID=UPI0036B515E4